MVPMTRRCGALGLLLAAHVTAADGACTFSSGVHVCTIHLGSLTLRSQLNGDLNDGSPPHPGEGSGLASLASSSLTETVMSSSGLDLLTFRGPHMADAGAAGAGAPPPLVAVRWTSLDLGPAVGPQPATSLVAKGTLEIKGHPAVPGDGWIVKPKTDYQGGDYRHFPLPRASSPASDCQAACEQDGAAKCTAWTCKFTGNQSLLAVHGSSALTNACDYRGLPGHAGSATCVLAEGQHCIYAGGRLRDDRDAPGAQARGAGEYTRADKDSYATSRQGRSWHGAGFALTALHLRRNVQLQCVRGCL